VRRLSAAAPCLVRAYPNAGLPNEFGAYDETPHIMCDHIEAFLKEGLVNIIGGCCGSTPEHIAEIAEMAKRYKPRSVPAAKRVSVYAGFEALRVDGNFGGGGAGEGANTPGFIRVGERTNVAGSKKFLNLITAGNFDDALNIPRDMIRAGADIINIGMDDPLLDAKAGIIRFVNLALADPEIAKKPFMIDSSRWEVIEAAVKCIGGKPLINSISLKEGEAEFLRKARAARDWGAAVVVMLFDEQGQAAVYERKIEIARRAYDLLIASGFPAEDIVFDPNVLTVVTGIAEHDSYALAFIRACAWIRENCPGAQISGGISNLSFSFRGNNTGREAMHAVFLKHAAEAGLTLAIVNPETLISYDSIDAELRETIEDVILCRTHRLGESAPAEKLLALALRIKAAESSGDGSAAVHDAGVTPGSPVSGGAGADAEFDALDAEERVIQSLIQGLDNRIESDIIALKQRYPRSLDIVEGPLMRAMREVGDRFGTGKMYLPQIIRSARVMQKAVAALEPFARQESEAGEVAPPLDAALPGSKGNRKILLATVKGDVHDIGKNIVSVVLGCSGYEVIDLGVQVPAARIVERAVAEGAHAVGLSGLITPSLDEMIAAVREMERRGLTIPLLIGGATTSLAHTALRIAPEYSGPVVYVSDASRAAAVLRALFSPLERARFLEELETRYREAAEHHEKIAGRRETLSLAEARKNRFLSPWNAPEPRVKGIVELNDYPLERVIPRINWTAFLRAFEMNGAGDRDGIAVAETEKLLADAKALLNRVTTEKLLTLKGVAGIFPAASENETLLLFEGGKERARFSFSRNLNKRRAGGANPCLADFVAPTRNGTAADWAGLFALSAGFGLAEAEAAFRAEHDEYDALILANLANTLAEAFSEEVHERLAREYWGYAAKGDAETGQATSGLGIRPAFGYPACPEHEDKRKAFALLEAQKRCGLALTESAMIAPAASVCGLYFAHPGSFYFSA
jgi:5-methyltetrahydrofolate--homocysteine methyltransferase